MGHLINAEVVAHANALHAAAVHSSEVHASLVGKGHLGHATLIHTNVSHALATQVATQATLSGIGPLIPPPFALTPALVAHEVQIGSAYAATHGGLLPTDAFWEYLIYRHDINPVTFDSQHNHVSFAALLDRNEAANNQNNLLCPPPAGLVPNTPYWNYLRYRHDSSPANFDKYHPQLASLLNADEALRQQQSQTMTCPPAAETVTPPVILPPPAGQTTPPTTVTGGSFTPGIPLQVPGGQTTPPQIQGPVVPEPSSVILLASGLLLLFLAFGLVRGWKRQMKRVLGPA